MINWYPGHIAKAEHNLKEYLKMVDVVIEVRDARILQSTTHPMVKEWVGNRPLLVCVNRMDCVGVDTLNVWRRHLNAEAARSEAEGGAKVSYFFVNSKRGGGIHEVKRAALKAGAFVNERRARRGIRPRAVRAAVIGYPNVGKSALINRLVGRAVAKSMNTPGVTRVLTWVRIGRRHSEKVGQASARGGSGGHVQGSLPELELLDSPGIIPAKQVSQDCATRLAICNDIGQASYDTQVVAARMVDLITEAHREHPIHAPVNEFQKRYGIDPLPVTGEEYVYELAESLFHGSAQNAADRLLSDFRKGFLGNIALEIPVYDSPAPEPEKVIPKRRKEPMAGEGSVTVGVGDFEGW
eukprot:CAMPEP_0113934652 /NCGR_PEP_ID=MMETSP1339-20121228/1946_1 /TAXON_ID=94617 /ORGANISM="Fibrocapsa japonica" /LENGTH=352 /DNA_ID=CAMNT_0000936535 /DNA_START=320 /DNA_END=1375 /DNA_ORIENTATION=+ /assembly_acc=CAM_ASM_000762